MRRERLIKGVLKGFGFRAPAIGEMGNLQCLFFALSIAGAVRAADPPKPMLQIQSANAAQVVQPTAKQPIRFTLTIPDEPEWAQINMGQCVVREASIQRNLPVRISSAKRNTLDYTFEEPGYALIAVCFGPSDGVQRSDSWRQVTQCTKRIVRVVGEGHAAETKVKDPGVTAKVGQRMEFVPLISPAVLRPGDDLPIRLFVDYEKATAAPVVAYAPDGSKQEAATDAVGAVNFSIHQAGSWLIRHERVVEGARWITELAFDVEARAVAEENRP